MDKPSALLRRRRRPIARFTNAGTGRWTRGALAPGHIVLAVAVNHYDLARPLCGSGNRGPGRRFGVVGRDFAVHRLGHDGQGVLPRGSRVQAYRVPQLTADDVLDVGVGGLLPQQRHRGPGLARKAKLGT